MKNLYFLTLLIISIIFISCSENKSKYPLEKPYWTPSDYNSVINTIKYLDNPEEGFPTLDNPETRLIVEKLTDENNYLVVVNDNELGLKHKNEIASDFFEKYRNMSSIYYVRDRKDNFIYEKEMLSVYSYGLGLQLQYFKIGNEEIAQDSDDPNSDHVKNVINSNVLTLINNYNNFIDLMNEEKSFSEEGLAKYSEIIDKHFLTLVNSYPEANYYNLKNKINLIEKKVLSNKVKQSLQNVQKLIDKKETEKAKEVS
jgi:hypothetical protein